MRKLIALAAMSLAVVLVTSSAQAITNGQPDNGRHPYVGLMVALDADGVPLWRCSGSLISANAFLTAGHCTEAPAAHVEIWFDEGPVTTDPDYLTAVRADPDGIVSCTTDPNASSFDGYPCTGDVGGTPHPNPDFCTSCGNGLPAFAFRDVGVVTLDDSFPMGDYAALPEPGLVDTLANKTPADFVGYGVQFQAQIPGSALPQPPPFYRWTGPRERMYAPTEIVSGSFKHAEEFVRFALNPGGGSGGTCFGDSGGPDLLGGTSTVLAVNSYVTNVNCGGVGYGSRVDIPEVLEWIESFM